MAAPSDFVVLTRGYLPGVLDKIVSDAALRAITRFAKETLCWTDEADGITFVGGTNTYSVTLPSGSQVVAGKKVWVDGNEDFPLKCWSFNRDDMELTIDSGASDGDAIHFEVALEPTPTSTTVPDKFLNRYGQAIKHGIVSELAAQPGNPWTNFELSQYHETMFVREVNRVRIALNKEHTTSSLRAQSRRFV